VSTILKAVAPLDLKFKDPRYSPPAVHGLRAFVQGQIVFIGDNWYHENEARALRDWLNEVLP
jgi:hypothetical protein